MFSYTSQRINGEWLMGQECERCLTFAVLANLYDVILDGNTHKVCSNCVHNNQLFVCQVCNEYKPTDYNLRSFKRTENFLSLFLQVPHNTTYYYQCVQCHDKWKSLYCSCNKPIEKERYEKGKRYCSKCAKTIEEREERRREKNNRRRLKNLTKIFKQYENINVNPITNAFTDWILSQTF